MFRLHFAYMSPYQVLEYHMEFLETFGCIWSSKEVIKVIIGRAERWERPSRSDPPGATPSGRSLTCLIRATLPERCGEVARHFIPVEAENWPGATYQSDHSRSLPKPRATWPEWHPEVARISIAWRQHNGARATSRSDTARSLPKHGATTRSDERRSLRVLFLLELMISQGPFGHFMMHVFIF